MIINEKKFFVNYFFEIIENRFYLELINVYFY